MTKHTIPIYLDFDLETSDEDALIADAATRVRDIWPESWIMTIEDALSILVGAPQFLDRLAPALAGWHAAKLVGVYAPMPDKQPPQAR